MPNVGTFKPFCKRGHQREGNLDASGHCLSCGRAKKNGLVGPTATGVFKPHCLRGHERAIHASKTGHCRECKKVWARYHWKNQGIMNADGSPFVLVDFDRAYQVQSGRCLICQVHQSEMKRSLSVDHDHETGIFRGLLCHGCNGALGLLKESAEVVERLLNYVRGKA